MTSVEDTLRIRYKVREDAKKQMLPRECIKGPPKTLDKQPVQSAPVMRSISGPDLLALSYKADVGLQMLADMHHEGLPATS